MVHVDWAFYIGTYRGGVVPQSEFPALAARAALVLDQLTFGRIDGVYAAQESTRLACCALCDTLYQWNESGGRDITRERLDSYDVTYATPAAETLARRMLQAVRPYLWRTGLLSRAVEKAGLYG